MSFSSSKYYMIIGKKLVEKRGGFVILIYDDNDGEVDGYDDDWCYC